MRHVGRLAGSVLFTIVAAACASVTPSPPPSVSHYDGSDLAFDYPAIWNAASFPVMSSFSSEIVYLSTSTMADPCDRTANSIDCTRSAAASLGPGGVLVDWSRNGFPGWTFDRSKGKSATIGGRAATIEALDPSEPCQAIGGIRELVATIDDVVPDQNWTQARACLAGPSSDAAQAQVEAMLRTVVFHQ